MKFRVMVAVSNKVVTKNIKTPDPITEEGIQKSVDIMKTGRPTRTSICSEEVVEPVHVEIREGLQECKSSLPVVEQFELQLGFM